VRSVCWVGLALLVGCGPPEKSTAGGGAGGIRGGRTGGGVVQGPRPDGGTDGGVISTDAGFTTPLEPNTLVGDLAFNVKHVRIQSSSVVNGQVQSVLLVMLDHEADCNGSPINASWPLVEKVLVVWLTSNSGLTGGTLITAPVGNGAGQMFVQYLENTNFHDDGTGKLVADVRRDLQNPSGWARVGSMELREDGGMHATGEFDLDFQLGDGGIQTLGGAFDARRCP
jgi:hypothetical protein